jgi:DNA polymerase-3 subunit delta'
VFSRLIGNEAAIRLLKGEIAGGRLAPSYLFTGLPGIGKRSLGLAFAQAVLCGDPSSATAPGEACGRCPACQGVGAGRFPDLIAVSPESPGGSIRIESVRQMANGMRLTPHTGAWKVGLVEEAVGLAGEAANAWLKLIEEPPEKSVFVITSSASYRLAPTLLSRCQRIRCWPQGIGRVAQFLERQEGLSTEAARGLATLSGGRVGLALRWHQGNGLARKNLLLDELLAALRRGALETPLGKAPRLEVEEALDGIAAWWRDLLLLRLGADRSWIIHQDRLADLEREAKCLGSSIEPWVDRVERAYRARAAVQANASPRMALATVLV